MKVELVRQALKVVSGGQTGADQAALQWAIDNEVDHGGWCPKGRKTEQGVLDANFRLKETPSASYLQRTEWNVRDSDATIIFTMAEPLTGGSRRTAEFARKHEKPCIAFTPGQPLEKLAEFLSRYPVRILNIAGSRHSTAPDVGIFVRQSLDAVIRLLDSTAELVPIRDLVHGCGTGYNRLLVSALVELLKHVFLLSIPLMTKPISPEVLDTEALQPAHARVLRRWLAEAPGIEQVSLECLREFLSDLNSWAIFVTDQTATTWPGSETTQHRTMMNLCHDIKERALAAALQGVPLLPLTRLASRWLNEKTQNTVPDVLESLGLTADTLVEFPESELQRLNLIARLKEEDRAHLAKFGRFLEEDGVGRQLVSAIKAVLVDV